MTDLVTDAGIADVVSALLASGPDWIGWGSGSGQGVTATDLASPLPEARVEGTGAIQTTTITGDTLRLTGSISATGSRTVSEVGVFSAVTGANLAIYGDFNALSLNTNDVVNFTVDVVVARAA